MSTLQYLSADRVTGYARDASAPIGRHRSASGYGGMIPTTYRIMLTDGRFRRVYVMCYSNSGSAYVRINGKNVFLSVDVEYALQELS